MSQNLYWNPVKTGTPLPKELLRALRSDVSPFMGRLGARPTFLRATDGIDMFFLRGLAAAECPGAAELLATVERLGEVELVVE